MIQELVKVNDSLKKLAPEFVEINSLVSLDDMISAPACDNMLLSLARSAPYEQRPEEKASILGKEAILKFVLSKVTGTLVVFGRAESLSPSWQKVLHERAIKL